ncbi:MAG: hypothetical protein B6I20_08505 [Bacteroidetes bacterium 4572_117]|nr:MAG: hypothetical protein B6I20_08505 [Bacteroidetes bacterium 4572_117]
MRKALNIVIIISISALLSTCSREQTESVFPKTVKIEKHQKQLVLADNKLGFDIYKNVSQTDKQNSNILISPINLNKSLGFLLHNSKNNRNIKLLLRLSNLQRETICSEINKLNDILFNIDKQSIFKNTTSFETNEQIDFGKDFKDFVSSNNIKIKSYSKNSYISNNKPNTQAFNLNNEISFKYNYKFQTGVTESPFYLNPDESIFVKTLICESEFNFYSDDILKAIEVPLGRGNFNSLIILPEADQSIKSIKNKLSQFYVNKMNKKFRKLNISAYLPQLDINYSSKLNNPLEKRGLRNLFDSRSPEFINISKDKELYLEEFSQLVSLKTISKPVSKNTLFDTNNESKNIFLVDRPFLMVITEKFTGAILFMGQITNPNE